MIACPVPPGEQTLPEFVVIMLPYKMGLVEFGKYVVKTNL
jgi:hypothetical protein